MEKWFVKNTDIDYREMARKYNIPQLTAKILSNRGIYDERSVKSYMKPTLDKLHDPILLKDMEKAVNIIKKDIKEGNKIRIVGDFDVDGITSVYILQTGIKELGGIVDYDIPDRVEDGYGINNNILDKAKSDGVETIITCDNGISAIEEIKYGKSLGLNIIVTDHHELPFIEENGVKEEIYVEADAIVNPKQGKCSYPFKKLCGAGVAYKVIEVLFERFNKNKDDVYKFLEYAAIATICDVVDLVDENRIIVKKGLEMVNSTKNIGLKALIEETDLSETEIGVYHIGFIIGPSINASGRLDSAAKALEMLLSEDENKAREFALELRVLNDERKEITEKGTEKIIAQIENSELKNDKVFLIYEPSIHESVAGIIAGRIKDRYYRPTIILTDGLEGVKGSARSIEAYNIFEELNKRKSYLNHFGGHPMAAGLSMDLEKIDELRIDLNNTNLTEDDLIPKVYIDLPLPIEYVDYRLIEEIDKLEPFGKGNSKPLFGDRNVLLKEARVLGENKNVLKLSMRTQKGNTLEGMLFNNVDEFLDQLEYKYGKAEIEKLYRGLESNIKIDIIYYPDINEFRGRTTLQGIIQSFRI